MDYFRERDIAWSAGLFEGEGTVCLTDKSHPWPIMQVIMKDREPIERLAAIFGGKASGPYKPPGQPKHWSPRYRWALGGWDAVRFIYELWHDDLSPRRRQQFEDTLSHQSERGRLRAVA